MKCSVSVTQMSKWNSFMFCSRAAAGLLHIPVLNYASAQICLLGVKAQRKRKEKKKKQKKMTDSSQHRHCEGDKNRSCVSGMGVYRTSAGNERICCAAVRPRPPQSPNHFSPPGDQCIDRPAAVNPASASFFPL